VVALTGTDLYRDIHTDARAQRSLQMADRLIVLQPRGRDQVPPGLRGKVRVIYQSALPTRRPPPKSEQFFDVCILGHLRREKDPFRTALALRLLAADSHIRVVHAGQALTSAMAQRAKALSAEDPRYLWLGETPRWRARRLLAGSRLLVLSSLMEGGANVIGEAIVDGVPVLASRIAGSVGLLGAGYPGLFPVGDTAALARLLGRAQGDARFYQRLENWCHKLAPRFVPVKEQTAWAALLREVVPSTLK
jgi:putative glycosyltransferase (TIGR04348 family)